MNAHQVKDAVQCVGSPKVKQHLFFSRVSVNEHLCHFDLTAQELNVEGVVLVLDDVVFYAQPTRVTNNEGVVEVASDVWIREIAEQGIGDVV